MDKNRYNEEGFEDYLQYLIKSGQIKDKEAGIAKLMLDKGYDLLSDKQKWVFDNMIENNSIDKCNGFCNGNISWQEMPEALDNGGYCSHCQHLNEEIEKD